MESYDGGKGQAGVWQKIINQMPPHDVYIEAFLGMGAVLRRKKPARVSFGVELDPDVLAKWEGVQIPGLRLRRADAITFLDVYPWSGGELVYCDPPYVRSTRSSQRDLYRYEMSDEEHQALLTVLKRLACPVIISGYWSELYAEELRGWRTLSFPAVKRNGSTSEEWLWCNFPEPVQLHDYSHLGETFRERERIKRKRLRWERMLREMPPLECHAVAAALATVSDERSRLVVSVTDV